LSVPVPGAVVERRDREHARLVLLVAGVALVLLLALGGCCRRVEVFGPIPECVVPPSVLRAPDSTKASARR